MRKFFQTKRMMSFVCVLFTAILSLCSINIINYHDLLTTSTEEQTLNETDETNRGGEFTTSENENLDDVTANAPTNSGYWTDSGNYATSFAGGSGTSTNPYLISTPQQLARLAYLINGSSSSTYRALYYEQTTNLNMSAYWWDAIGYSSSYYFGGHYNGGGFTIAGLYTEAGTKVYLVILKGPLVILRKFMMLE